MHARVTGGFETLQLQLGLCMITSSLCSTNHFCAEAYQVAIGTQDRRMPADGRKQWAWSTCCPRSLRAFEVNPGASSSNARSNLPLPLLLLLAIASCGELSNWHRLFCSSYGSSSSSSSSSSSNSNNNNNSRFCFLLQTARCAARFGGPVAFGPLTEALLFGINLARFIQSTRRLFIHLPWIT